MHSINDKCSKCGMKEDATKKGCCKEEHKQLKLATDHQKSAATSFTNIISTPAFIKPLLSYHFQIQKFETVTDIIFHPPQNLKTQKLTILYCTFLI